MKHEIVYLAMTEEEFNSINWNWFAATDVANDLKEGKTNVPFTRDYDVDIIDAESCAWLGITEHIRDAGISRAAFLRRFKCLPGSNLNNRVKVEEE